jgi:hypothetical protein
VGLKSYTSWKRNNPDTQNGESLTITIVYSSFNKEDIDELEKRLQEGVTVYE